VSLDDRDLLARVAEGRTDAFAELYERYAARLCAFLQPSLGHAGAAETTQEVLMRVWRNAHRFDPSRASAATWIYAIARNARTDRFRRMGRPEPDPDDPMWVPSAPDSPDAQIEAQRRARRLHDALGSLPAAQREVMERAYLRGQSMSEIADELGLPLGTVKSRSRLALKRLREALAEEPPSA